MLSTIDVIVHTIDGPAVTKFANESDIHEDHFLSFEEIVEDVVANRLPDEEVKFVKAQPQDKLIRLHHNLGRWIRNSYGLWFESNPHCGTHPDDFSQRIIEQVWIELNKEEIANEQSARFEHSMKVLD